MLVTAVLIRAISLARRTAFQVLEQVAEGAYAADALLDASRGLPSRDAGLASQIVFGCLRFQLQLDWLAERYSGRRIASLDFPVKLALRAGIFQMRYLQRIPAHAAVHDAVEYVKQRRRSASGLVNAVLHKVNRDPVPWPSQEVELCCPQWLLDSWKGQFGDQAARGIAEAALTEPEHYVRLPVGHAVDPELFEPTGIAGCYRALRRVPERTGVEFRFQDIGSQALVPLLDLLPGISYLDLCAAPGNKTVQAAETQLGFGVACDVSLRRLRTVPPVFPRVVLDAGEPLPFRRSFDRVFVDAPCSGTGTLARNPEIKWRVHRDDFSRFQEKQVAILEQALRSLAPGGKLLYATCSLQREENEDVVRRVLAAQTGEGGRQRRRCEQELWRLPGREAGDGFYAAVLA